MKFRCYYESKKRFGYAELKENKWNYDIPNGTEFNWNKAEQLITHDNHNKPIYEGDIVFIKETEDIGTLGYDENKCKYYVGNEFTIYDNEDFVELNMVVISNVHQMNEKVHSVYVGGGEANEYLLDLEKALELAFSYKNDDYDDVCVSID